MRILIWLTALLYAGVSFGQAKGTAGLHWSESLRQALWHWVDSSRYLGLDSSRYHYAQIRAAVTGAAGATPDSMLDPLFTDAALSIARDLHDGTYLPDRLHYDELAAHSPAAGDLSLAGSLDSIRTALELNSFLQSREPHSASYAAYRNALRRLPDSGDPLREIMLGASIDYQRWIDHFNFTTYILVNVASATLRLYEGDSIRLQMKVVAGKPSTPTPRFSARCTEVILYPYWNIPQQIAVREFLPLFKREPSLMDVMGIEAIDRKGKVIDPQTLPWSTLTRNNFPYRLRQLTGCGNALGVIKFELTDPFDIYLHDTNLKSAFASASRYYSHGCIRLEKPFLLARELLGDKLDTMYLTECRKDQQPRHIPLDRPVAVLVVYMPVEADAVGNLAWYKDSYHLLAGKPPGDPRDRR